MRFLAALAVLALFGLAVYLAASTHRRPPEPASVAPAPLQTTNTHSPDGFFIGEGDDRTYVQYATPDPVLRSFMQSVMDGSGDPITKGREIFTHICAACHQKQGEGKDGLAPPLAGSEWVLAPGGERLVRIVLNGLGGPIQVRGKTWNLAMPPLKENLRDDQIAVVLSYVRSHVGDNHAGTVTSELSEAARKENRAKPETVQTLMRVEEK